MSTVMHKWQRLAKLLSTMTLGLHAFEGLVLLQYSTLMFCMIQLTKSLQLAGTTAHTQHVQLHHALCQQCGGWQVMHSCAPIVVQLWCKVALDGSKCTAWHCHMWADACALSVCMMATAAPAAADSHNDPTLGGRGAGGGYSGQA